LIVSAHQPNYLPWTGYFFKMMYCDTFILADGVQYTTQGYINRVQIKTSQGIQWLTVPVLTRGKGLQKIKDIRIAQSQNWRRKHWRTIFLNYKYASYFDDYAGYFEKVYQKEWIYLLDLNIELLSFIKNSLHINCSFSKSSEYKVPETPTERIVGLVKKSRGDEYISGKSGRNYLKEDKFLNAGIKLKSAGYKAVPYRQQFGDFIPNLSIIDLLFNEGPDAGRYLQNAGEIVSHKKKSDDK
jgi:hypothetical protein